MNSYKLSYLKQLEAESIFLIREAVAQFENPVLLFSGGKDSIVMAHLARKAFWPSKLPSRCCMSIPAITFPKPSSSAITW
jgi:sulfate adenylyltransferase subunit 2